MSRLGAYYQTQLLDPIKGLGAVSAQASLAHESLRPLLMGPSGNYAAWAAQDATGWTSITPKYNYRAYPINAKTLRQAEAESLGNQVGLVAAVFSRPITLNEAELLFATGPYSFSHAEAVYRLDDREAIPRPYYLYWATLADEGENDRYGSYEQLEDAIVSSQGEFVFVMPDERTGKERPHPTVDVNSVLPGLAPSAPSAPTTVPTTAPVQPAATHYSQTRPSFVVLGIVGGLGALIGWSLVS
jgi:hypothetical protein